MPLQRCIAAFALCAFLLPAPMVLRTANADQLAATPAATPPPEPVVPPTDADKTMAVQAVAAAKLDSGTPGQEAMNFLMNGWPHYGLDILSGKTPATEKQLIGARALVAGLLDPMEKGPGWPKPTLTHVPHAAGPITIDGKLDDPGWKNALVYRGAYEYNAKDFLTEPETTVRVTWDERNLYFAFDCKDADIIAPPLARDANPFDYDSVEMFILPVMNPPKYWEIVIGPQGAIYDGFHTKALTMWGTAPEPKPDKDYNIDGLQTAQVIERDAVTGKDIGYKVEVAVPFNQLPTYTDGKKPAVGDTLHIMLARMDKNGDKERYYSVVPLLSWGHNIWNYIPIKLEKASYRQR